MTRYAAMAMVGLLFIAGCERGDAPPAGADAEAPAATPGAPDAGGTGATATGEVPPRAPEGGAMVELIDRDGQRAGGARLEAEGDGVRISVRVTGLSGTHALHFHETGQCDPPSFQSAGGHFNPHGRQHGFENPQGPHAGDLPNIRANAEGVADTSFVVQSVRLDTNSANGLLRQGGTALVVHAGPDDYRTDPSGASGDRIACGVVRGG